MQDIEPIKDTQIEVQVTVEVRRELRQVVLNSKIHKIKSQKFTCKQNTKNKERLLKIVK